MSTEALERAHRLFDLERDYLLRRLQQDPLYAGLLGRVARTEAALLKGLKPDQALALAEARRMLFEVTFEAAFKMGYLYAHTYPLDEPGGP